MLKPIGALFFALLFSAAAQDPYLLTPRINDDPSFDYTESPEDWRDLNVYQLFTDRFSDGDSSNNNARSMRGGSWWDFNTAHPSGDTTGRSWYNTANSAQANDRHLAQGGDWEGIRQQIPYLQSMGVKAVWLSSVQKVEQGVDKRFTPYHAYHPTDLYKCEPLFGDFAKLKQTIDDLHAAGIYVILDVVPNHMADLIRRTSGDESYDENCTTFDINWADGVQHASPFNRLDWFHCNGNIGNYDAFPETQLGGFKGTDDLATERADVQAELAIAFKNLIDATDCDGFRVDAIKHVDQTWIKNWATEMRTHAASRGKDDFLIFGELFSFDDGYHNAFTGDQGSGFNSAMWFSMMNTLRDVFAGSGATSNLTAPLNGIWNGNTFGNEANMRTIAFIDNHDVDRVSKSYTTSWEDMLRPAMGLLYCATPVPTLYYGTEHGFNQGEANNNIGADDADYQRENMMDFGYQWGNAQGNKFTAPSSIKTLIGQINAAREQYICLRRGSFQQRWETGGRGIYAFTRQFGNQEALIILNTDWDNAQSATPGVATLDGTTFTNVLDTNETLSVSGGTLNVSVPTRGLKIFVAGGTAPPLAISNTRNFPVQGSITTSDDLFIDSDTSPQGTATSGTVHYSTDAGGTFLTSPLARNPSFDTTTTEAWNVNLGTFAAGATIDYYVTFDDGSNTFTDDNGGANYSVSVNTGSGGGSDFVLDGSLDSANYLISDNGMRLWAAVKGTKLYFATWSTEGGTADHYVLCSTGFGNPEAHPWGKAGTLNYFFGGWPWLAAEGDNNFATINNGGISGGHAEGPNGGVLEGVIDLVEVFGAMPETVYLSALAYGTNTGDAIVGQTPIFWQDDNLDIMEMAPVTVESIRDEDLDGYFDRAAPTMESTVNGNVADADYGLRRFFIDETTNDTGSISISFTPNANPGETVTNVEVITNLNRRNFAVIQENRDLATGASNTYYRAYPMTESSGTWSATLPVNTCGAYRATVRYYVDGAGPFYFTDGGLRRDLAIVVSPTNALDTTLYEVNPAIVEATDSTPTGRSTFRDLWMTNTDRPDAVNTQKFNDLGVNMIWLQPIHPIGTEGRQIDPLTMTDYDPGSPYSVKDYWQVAPFLGANNTEAGAMSEFQTMVTEFDNNGIGVMVDGTFNHSAPDAILGQGAVDLYNLPAGDLIRDTRPGWYSKTGDYSMPATSASEQAVAPDRRDFGKFVDVRELYFGNYDALVKFDSDSHTYEFLLERDHLDPITATTEELWDYFAYYPIYWLTKTGHPVGTPVTDAHKGIDGMRCDFAQGLPNEFWEYCINKTRSVKWNFLFMAESLDGFINVDGDPRHGVSYRSARHFDILNENIVFYWRDTWFDYPADGPSSGGAGTKTTFSTFDAYRQRRDAYDNVVLLNNLTSHDEVFPSDNPYELLNTYAQVAAFKGIPMVMYGQEAGALNDFTDYGFTGDIPNADNNWSIYEQNFGKTIPNFKRYNDMTKVWLNADTTLESYYGRVNSARLNSPALRSDSEYFLSKLVGGGLDDDIMAVAKYENAGVSAKEQDVVFAFINNDPLSNSNRMQTFDLSPEVSPGVNWFGIDPAANYNAANLLATDPTQLLWPTDRTGQNLIDNGLTIVLDQPLDQLGQAQYLKLVDTSTVTDDADMDGLPDTWEALYSLDHSAATGATGQNGASGNPDGDNLTNAQEYLVGLNPTIADSEQFQLCIERASNGDIELTFSTIADRLYQVEYSDDDLASWNNMGAASDTTGLATNPAFLLTDDGSQTGSLPTSENTRFYKLTVTFP
ncbi:MAG: alpha-amylase family glycosyl hydrolase [Roseibacillus sp.]